VRFYGTIESHHKTSLPFGRRGQAASRFLLPLVVAIPPGEAGMKYAVRESNSEPLSGFADGAPASVVRISQPSSTPRSCRAVCPHAGLVALASC
jgi:hypothetical protein